MTGAHRQIALAPWPAIRNAGSPRAHAATAAAMFLPALAAGTLSSARLGLQVGTATLALLLLLVWISMFGQLLRQNQPNAARLVPGHVRRLREVAAGLFVTLAAASGLLLGAMFGDGLVFALAAAGLQTLFALTLRWPLLWFATFALPMPVALFEDSPAWLAGIEGLQRLWLTQPALVAMAGALLLPTLVCLCFQEGGAGHRRGYARGERLRQAMRAANVCARRCARPCWDRARRATRVASANGCRGCSRGPIAPG